MDAQAPVMQAFTVRQTVTSGAQLRGTDITACNQAKTGWAVTAATAEIRDRIIESRGNWTPAIGAVGADRHTRWYHYAVGNVPRVLNTLGGRAVPWHELVNDEVTHQNGQAPIRCNASKNDDPGSSPTLTVVVALAEPTTRPWKLFSSSRVARLITKSGAPKQCETCWDYHPRTVCDRKLRCGYCGRNGWAHSRGVRPPHAVH